MSFWNKLLTLTKLKRITQTVLALAECYNDDYLEN